MAYEQPRKAGFWRRIWNAIVDHPATSAPTTSQSGPPIAPQQSISEATDVGAPMEIPARGEVFNFLVQMEAVWSVDAKDIPDLHARTDRKAASAQRAVYDAIWAIGREYAPHQAQEAEEAMVERLRKPICFDDGGTQVRCEARVRVRSDPRVLTVLEPYWRRYVEMESEHLLGMLRADRVKERTEHWRTIMNELADVDFGDLVLPYAAQLTDNAFADAVGSLENDRQRARVDLVTVLGNASKSHTRMGMFEFADAYDKAIKAFKKSQGLGREDEPRLDPDMVDADGSS